MEKRPNYLKISFPPLILSNSRQIKENYCFSLSPNAFKKVKLEGAGYFS
jgi:hypothetical protein